MRKIALGLVALTFASSAALAQTPITFAQLDIDGDGRLSLAELQVAWPDMTESNFAAVDVEGVGSITPAQLDTLQPSAVGTTGSGTIPADTDTGATGFSSDDTDNLGETDNADDASMAPNPSLLE